jgi:hypothetical protein
MRMAILIHLFAALLAFDASAHVKSVTPKPDELLLIKTALGIATIVQTPLPIQSAIIGDQSGFKVEYLDRAVTIKPLRAGAKTNLYLLTEKKRFNLRLLTLTQDQSDYVVYIKDEQGAANVQWRVINKEAISDGIRLKVLRVGISPQGFILVDGNLSSDRNISLKPENFWILQRESSKVIDSLYLSSLEITIKQSVPFGISVSKSDLDQKQSLTLQLRLSKTLSIQIPEGIAWKQ